MSKLNLDLNRDQLLTEQGYKLVKQYYMLDEEASPQQAFERAALCFCAGDYELAQRIYDYVSQQWFMFSSPILSNARVKGKPKGLPISCFLSYVPDTVEGLINHQAETEWLSVKGGGVGGHWGDVRSVDSKSPGPIPFIHTIDAAMTAYKQGETRKGAYAAYTDISHPSIVEFLQLRVPTGGDVNRKCFNIHNAINIPDVFMEKVVSGEDWELIDPHTNEVKDVVKARDLWQRILETRYRTGEPYLNFIDTVNKDLNPYQKELGLTVKGSNLCNEIHLVTDEERTAVCCLSSVNLEKWDEWKDTSMVKDLIRFLDNVLQYFIDHCPDEMSKARYSAIQERSLGLGAMGWHGLLMKKSIPFESALAVSLTNQVFSKIKLDALEETDALGKERGVPNDLLGSGRRNAHLLAIAPNANSSIICNCTPSIEPVSSNSYTHRTRVGSHLVRNPHLERLLEARGENNGDVWTRILREGGSVQGLAFLTDWEKDVFKTFKEIDQNWVIEQSSFRQKYLCQGQSVNLTFPPECGRGYFNEVHLNAWKKGLKGLYYVRTGSGADIDKVSVNVERKPLSSLLEDEGCISCEG